MIAAASRYEVAIRAGSRCTGATRLPRLRRLGRASAPPRRPRGCWASTRRRRLPRSASRSTTRRSRRSCAAAPIPAMTKDACAWGAFVGVSSALLAARGFTSVRSEFRRPSPTLGRAGGIEELYVKAYPCCRWSQGAIAAALGPPAGLPPASRAGRDRRVRIRTFAAADGLARSCRRTPRRRSTTSSGRSPARSRAGGSASTEVLGPFADPDVTALFERIRSSSTPSSPPRSRRGG